MTSHRVSAILVVHDGATWLPEVVASLASQTRVIDQIVAVDTGSRDSSAKLLKGARIPILTMPRETGFGAAVASAVEKLPPSTAHEWLWILHDDCAVDPKALESLLLAVEERPNVVLAGPKLLGWHDRTHLLEIGISIATNGARWTNLEDSEYDQGQHDGIADVLAVSTAGALIRRDVFEELGGFDQNLELFRDDVDFGWRVHAAGHAAIVVTDAIAYHAQASATERRAVDVKGALLKRPLLLDRQNAAYVLLANATWWLLPLLTLQLFGSALLRALGYLFAKLPGYAGDEILAIASLVVKPGELIEARKDRKATRLVSARVVSQFIPSRGRQLRLAIDRAVAAVRDFILKPTEETVQDESMLDLPTEKELHEEDLLTPVTTRKWISLFSKPFVIVLIFLVVLTLIWSRNRIGAVSGGTLAPSPSGARDLWDFYFSPWHQVGLGSKSASPLWMPLIAIASLITFGNISIFISLFFIAAPILLFSSAHHLVKKVSDNRFITAAASLLYALSPITISAINTGRLGVIVLMFLAPFLVPTVLQWKIVETFSIRKMAGLSLLLALIFSFAPTFYIAVLILTLVAVTADLLVWRTDANLPLLLSRLIRRTVLLLAPIALTIPWSLEIVSAPQKFFIDIGLLSAGGGPNLAFFANPGGAGSLPWWLLSPVSIVLAISLFSIAQARHLAYIGGTFICVATISATFAITGKGTSTPNYIYPGVFIALATLAATYSAVVMLDRVRERLIATHINYRHFAVSFLVILSAIYGVSATGWITAKAASAPLQSAQGEVLPPYLAIETLSKTLVLRERLVGTTPSLNYYIARGRDVSLGEADVVPSEVPEIAAAVTDLADGSGISSSKTFASYGITYIFLKAPTQRTLVQTIDGLGGFTRASSTSAGIVWKVAGATGNLIITDASGKSSLLEPTSVKDEYLVPSPGVVTLTESYSGSWHLVQNGQRLTRIKSELGLPQFSVEEAGSVILIHDGSVRRGWISLHFIVFLVVT
ncbi:MAG: glycosyltransferase, partial [Candidatus Planktophila sp.]